MGLLLQNITKFRKAFEATKGRYDRDTIIEWFGNQKAIQQTCDLENVVFESKSAVVIVGVSGIGKSAFAEKFLKSHSEFEFCSYDEFYYEVMAQTNNNGEEAYLRTNEIFERKLRNANRKSKSILIDGMLLSYGLRAAIFRTLQTFGYQIHVVYFPLKYANEKIAECSSRRAVEFYLYTKYAKENPRKYTIREAIQLRKNIISIYCENLKTTPEELYASYASNPTVKEFAKSLIQEMKNEATRNYVEKQEADNIFLCGAHYYYEIQ